LAASTRNSIGGGGSTRGTWGVVGCGRSTGIGQDTSGAVTMKMISSTSITSTSGVTLISAIGPELPAALNAMLRSFGEAARLAIDTTPPAPAGSRLLETGVQPPLRLTGWPRATFMHEPGSPRRC